MSKGQATIGLMSVVLGTSTLFMSWDAWLSIRSVEQGEQMASIAVTLENIQDDVAEVRDLTRLTAPRLGVNPDVIKIATTTQL